MPGEVGGVCDLDALQMKKGVRFLQGKVQGGMLPSVGDERGDRTLQG